MLSSVPQDVQLRWPAPSDAGVREAIARLRGAALLVGQNRDTLVDVTCRFSTLGIDLAPRVTALDLNPLLVPATGQVIAVDSLLELR